MKVTKRFLDYEDELINLGYKAKVLVDSKLFYKYTLGGCRIDIVLRNDAKILKKSVYLIDFELKKQEDIELLQMAFDTMRGDIEEMQNNYDL